MIFYFSLLENTASSWFNFVLVLMFNFNKSSELIDHQLNRIILHAEIFGQFYTEENTFLMLNLLNSEVILKSNANLTRSFLANLTNTCKSRADIAIKFYPSLLATLAKLSDDLAELVVNDLKNYTSIFIELLADTGLQKCGIQILSKVLGFSDDEKSVMNAVFDENKHIKNRSVGLGNA